MDDDLLRRTERWFLRQGVPTLVADYGLRTHAIPRTVPFLVPAAVIVATGTGAFVEARGLGAGEALLALVSAVLLYAGLAAASIAVAAYGLLPLALQATRHAVADLRGSLRLQSRALPTLLFVTFFLFFTGELWQLMDHLAWARLVLVLVLFAAVTVLATSARLRGEVDRIEHDLTPARLADACAGTPLAGRIARPALLPTPLAPRQETNLLLVLATRQLVQAAVVGVGLFLFFVILGAIVVDNTVAATWIGAPAKHSLVLPWLPVSLLRAAALLAGFGSMYFAITTMTQTEQRQEFFAPVIGDLERMLAVRAVYLDLRSQVPAAQTLRPTPP